MKSFKQFMAVFMTAVFLAASFPVTLSAADRRENASMVSAGSSTDTAADTDQQAETETVTEDRSGGFGPDDTAEDPTDADPGTDTNAVEETYTEPPAESPEERSAETDGATSAEISAQAGEEAREEAAAEKDSGVEAGSEDTGSQEDPSGTERDTSSENVSSPAVNASSATYTVTLNANGGGYYIDYNNQNAHVQTVTHTGEPEGRDISVYQIPKANPGKIFAGWSTSANGTVLRTGTTVTKNLYLYAIWEQGCAVTLDANGGHFTLEDGTESTTVMATVAKGERIFSYSFVSSGEPRADGKRLAGYGRMVNGSISLLPSTGGTGYTVTAEKLTLYAVWINVCEIT